jgi:hypothetical protein
MDISWSATGGSFLVLRQASMETGAVGVRIFRSLVSLVHLCVVATTKPIMPGADVIIDLNSSNLFSHLGDGSLDARTLQLTAEGNKSLSFFILLAHFLFYFLTSSSI